MKDDLNQQRLRLKIGMILVIIACLVALAAVTFGVVFGNFWLLGVVFGLETDYIKVFWIALCSFIIEAILISLLCINGQRRD